MPEFLEVMSEFAPGSGEWAAEMLVDLLPNDEIGQQFGRTSAVVDSKTDYCGVILSSP
jgi:hypothetical protein